MLTGLLYAMKGEIESLLPEGAEPEKNGGGRALLPDTGRTWSPAAAAWGR
ncbi:MAG: hypothetical protein ACLUYZ_00715 [Lachnospiraceae bacterium]